SYTNPRLVAHRVTHAPLIERAKRSVNRPLIVLTTSHPKRINRPFFSKIFSGQSLPRSLATPYYQILLPALRDIMRHISHQSCFSYRDASSNHSQFLPLQSQRAPVEPVVTRCYSGDPISAVPRKIRLIYCFFCVMQERLGLR